MSIVKKSCKALCIHRDEMRVLYLHHRPSGLPPEQSDYCGFDITSPLPSYWTMDRFINQLDHDLLDKVLITQVRKLTELGLIDPSFIAVDSTPIMANTSQNNPTSFRKNKFAKEN